MKRRQISWWAAGILLAASTALATPQGAPQGVTGPPPGPPPAGALNYVEGQASINGQTLDPKSVRSAVVGPGMVLSTTNGKVEMLLSPGVFLRIGENSQLRMVSSNLADTEVALDRGQATIEADYFTSANHLTVHQGMASTAILKRGFYVLNSTASEPVVQVLDGKAQVTLNGKHVNVDKDGGVIIAASGKLKVRNYNPKQTQDIALVRWSRLRSEYEAEANYETARSLAYPGYGPSYAYGPGYGYGYGPGWYNPGWYWDAGFGFWAFLPGDGFLYSPFGWGFYSPAYLYGYGGFYGRPGFGRGYGYGVARGGFVGGGGFHGGFAGGGGFHGGGGGRR